MNNGLPEKNSDFLHCPLGFPVCRKRETLLAALPFLLDPQPEPEPLIAGAVSSVSRSVFFVFPLIHSSYPSSTFSVLVLSFSFLCFFPEPDHHKQPGICESKAQEDPDSSIHRLQNYTAETYHSLPQRPWPLLLLLLLPPQPYRKEGGIPGASFSDDVQTYLTQSGLHMNSALAFLQERSVLSSFT
ncbi:hypothetical protein MRB53_016444 [Persea americana]|uniref:Uncharacterized protein n=1 Tax=Persea americana TaxID=3435 RepID=A0ACC2M2D8_PERAE|nr:hypothetical protein MRB53_016444 [Persea americana]